MSSIRNIATRRTLSAVIWTNKCLTALVCAADPVEEHELKEQLSTAASAKHKKTKRCMTDMMPWLFSKCNEFEMVQQPALEAK